LENWPDTIETKEHPDILKNMRTSRDLVSIALEKRAVANIKVRQPLSELTIMESGLTEEYLELICDEVNVKKVTQANVVEVVLDTNVTPELLEEGKVRDVIRSVQEWRKEQNLKPGEKAKYAVPPGEREFFLKHAEEIKNVTSIEFN
jgi:isoleucyl-tRNA synthetase